MSNLRFTTKVSVNPTVQTHAAASVPFSYPVIVIMVVVIIVVLAAAFFRLRGHRRSERD